MLNKMDKLLEVFIMEPEKKFHVRELSRKLKKSPTTISKHLKIYEKNHILTSEKKLNHLLFRASLSSPIFRQKKINYNLEKIYFSGLINFLRNELDYPEAIILFGSWAKGENVGQSDLDLLVISPIKKEINMKKFRKKLGDIHLFVLSNNRIKEMQKKSPEFVNSFVNGIVLDGSWEMFK